MTPRRGAFLAVTIGSMFIASAALGQQPRALRAEAQPTRQPDANRLDIDTVVADSEEDLARLQAGDARLQAKLKAEFQKGPEWKAAVEAVKRTTKEYESARKAVVSKLQTEAEYAKAASQYKKARQECDALTDRPADQQNRERLAKQVLAAHTAVGKLEAAALNADPEVERTRQAMLKAQADLTELKKRSENAHESHPEWLAHQKQIQAAKDLLSQARQEQQQTHAAQTSMDQAAQDRVREETLNRLQQELLRQQIILSMQQQQLAAAQTLLVRAPQMTTLGELPVTGPGVVYRHVGTSCVPVRVVPYYRPGPTVLRPRGSIDR